jgi:hypothetical protein
VGQRTPSRKHVSQLEEWGKSNIMTSRMRQWSSIVTTVERTLFRDPVADPPLLAAVPVTSSSISHMVNTPAVVGTAMIEPSSWTTNPSSFRSVKPYSMCKVAVSARVMDAVLGNTVR